MREAAHTTTPPPLRVDGGVHHLALAVKDLDSAERFWCGLLGLAVERRWNDEAGVPRSIWARLDERSFLAIERATSDGASREGLAPGWHCAVLAIRLEDRERWRSRLEAAGHPVERESPYTLYTRDPEGNLVGLSHWPAPAR